MSDPTQPPKKPDKEPVVITPETEPPTEPTITPEAPSGTYGNTGGPKRTRGSGSRIPPSQPQPEDKQPDLASTDVDTSSLTDAASRLKQRRRGDY